MLVKFINILIHKSTKKHSNPNYAIKIKGKPAYRISLLLTLNKYLTTSRYPEHQ